MNTIPSLSSDELTLWLVFFIILILAWNWPYKE